MRYVFTLILLAVLATASRAADMRIDGPSKSIPVGQQAVLGYSGPPAEQSWLLLHPRGTGTLAWAALYVPGGEGRDCLVFQALTAGSYTVAVLERQTGEYVAVTIQVGGDPVPPPPPDPNPYDPTVWRATVESIRQAQSLDRKDADAVAEVFARLSKVVAADSIKTVADLHAAVSRTDDKPPGLIGRYPVYLKTLAAVMEVNFPRDPPARPLDKDAAATLLEAIAWATWEAGQ